MKILIINGPNLNLLGTREPEIYGHQTLTDIAQQCEEAGRTLGAIVEFGQTNHEGEIIDWIQQAIGEVDAIVINAAGYTHSSIAIHDALKMFEGYKVELHISNPHLREDFRRHSYISPAVDAVVAGLGPDGYVHVVKSLASRGKKSLNR